MLAHKMGRMLGPRYYAEVRYEDLVRAPEQVLRTICAFLEEPFEAGMLQYYEKAGAAMPQDSLKYHQSSVKAPDPRKADSWRHEMVAADRALFDEVAGDTLRVFGYPQDDVCRGSWRNRLMRLKYTLIDRW